jgi:Holliday junction resolvase RusA-like endonuclease
VPKNASKETRRLMLQGDLMPVLTPDIDNIIKIILDGLNGAAYQDDKQVVAVVARKHYDITGHVSVMVEGLPKQ